MSNGRPGTGSACPYETWSFVMKRVPPRHRSTSARPCARRAAPTIVPITSLAFACAELQTSTKAEGCATVRCDARHRLQGRRAGFKDALAGAAADTPERGVAGRKSLGVGYVSHSPPTRAPRETTGCRNPRSAHNSRPGPSASADPDLPSLFPCRRPRTSGTRCPLK